MATVSVIGEIMSDAKATIKEIIARTIRECNCEHIELTDKHLIAAHHKYNKYIWRRRICRNCKGRFTTYEIIKVYFKYLKER